MGEEFDLKRRMMATAIAVQFVAIGILAWGFVEINRSSKNTLATVVRNQEDLTDLAKSGRAQSEFNETISRLIKDFNEGHASAAYRSFQSASEQRKCLAEILLKPPGTATMDDISKCDRGATPPPTNHVIPPEPKAGKP